MKNTVLLVLESSTTGVILRHTWLIHHSSVISWSTGDILKRREQCIPDYFLFLDFPRTLNQLFQWAWALHLSKVSSNNYLWRFLRPITIHSIISSLTMGLCNKSSVGETVHRWKIYPLSKSKMPWLHPSIVKVISIYLPPLLLQTFLLLLQKGFAKMPLFCCLGTSAWSDHLYQAGSTQCIQPHLDP